MKREIVAWSGLDLYKNRDLIQYPDYQREPHVWNEMKKKLLIDSMLRGIDIPKLYLYKHEDSDYYDCVDGQQRIVAVYEFFDGKLALVDGRTIDQLSLNEREIIYNYQFTIALITEADEDDLRLLFVRLQLGVPLNAGEKLHAMKGDMRDFVFDLGKNHPFFKKISIPRRRYAKETVFAQICINSFYKSLQDSFYSARFEDLKVFFSQHMNLEKFHPELQRIHSTLDKMTEHFKEDAYQIRNRASVVSAYLFFEELIKKGRSEKLDVFVEFYLRFLEKLRTEVKKGLDYDRDYRRLMDFQYYVSQAAVAKSSIESRHEILREYFKHYLETKEIKKG